MNNIKILRNEFNCTVGLSDHSKNVLVATAAVSNGAEIIETYCSSKSEKRH